MSIKVDRNGSLSAPKFVKLNIGNRKPVVSLSTAYSGENLSLKGNIDLVCQLDFIS